MVRTRGCSSAGGPEPHNLSVAYARRGRATSKVEHPQQKTLSRLVKKARSKRQRSRKGPYPTSSIKTLPQDLLVEVVATVASHSFVDLHAIKICCKDFLDATEDSYVWRKVSLDTFPLIQWYPNDKTSSFLNRCREYGNIVVQRRATKNL